MADSLLAKLKEKMPERKDEEVAGETEEERMERLRKKYGTKGEMHDESPQASEKRRGDLPPIPPLRSDFLKEFNEEQKKKKK